VPRAPQTDNILVSVTHDNEISALQIGDFDSAKVVLNESLTTVLETPRGQAVGTTGWQPPEIEGAIPDLWLSQAVDGSCALSLSLSWSCGLLELID